MVKQKPDRGNPEFDFSTREIAVVAETISKQTVDLWDSFF